MQVWIDSLLQARKAKAAKAVNAEAGGPMVASGATEHGASRGRSQPGLSSRQLAGREPDGAEGRLGAVAVDLEQSGAGSGDNVVRGDVGAEAGAAGVLSLWRHTTRSVCAWWDDWKVRQLARDGACGFPQLPKSYWIASTHACLQCL